MCMLTPADPAAQGVVHQMILGDLNTMGHGVARLSRHYCCDAMRWRTLGWYEAAWWHAHVLSQVSCAGLPLLPCPAAAFRMHCLQIMALAVWPGKMCTGSFYAAETIP